MDDSAALELALNRTRSPALAGIPVSIRLPAASLDLDSFTFDASVVASEVWLIGQPGSTLRLPSRATRRRLQAGRGALPLLSIRRGAPTLHLVQITLGDALLVDGGQLHMESCTVSGVDSGIRALHVLFGGVVAVDSRFENNEEAGAVAVEDGTLKLEGCELHANHDKKEEGKGGAVHVTGGAVVIENTRFSDNTATRSGGTLQVDGGTVQLANKTELVYTHAEGAAAIGNLVSLNGGKLTYTLPAPLGSWVRSHATPD